MAKVRQNHAPAATPLHEANRLGLDYHHEANTLPYPGPLIDVHAHIHDIPAAATFLPMAARFNIQQIYAMSPLEIIDELHQRWPDQLRFIAVPNYLSEDKDHAFTTDWLHRLERFAEKGVRICKIWAAPRGIDMSEHLRLDSAIRKQAMTLIRQLNYRVVMIHIADPDTWFATHYRDQKKYGTKADQYPPFERLLEEHRDLRFIAAHLAGLPEDIDALQGLMDRHPNLAVDTSATKWMVRELSKHPQRFYQFCKANPGRVLFGSDIVAGEKNMSDDLFASRYWALRTLFETDYDGPSPIVDPDLPLINPALPKDATAHLRGAAMDHQTLRQVYADNARHWLNQVMAGE